MKKEATTATASDLSQGSNRATQLEAEIGEIWRNALNIDEIAPDDGFFELGGDSIMLMAILVRVREKLHVDVTEHVLSAPPTMREFCQLISDLRTKDIQFTDDSDIEEGSI